MARRSDNLIADLQSHIEINEIEATERIGSERGLAEQFGVTRSELRAALEVLERAGRVRRTLGRTGGVFSWDGKFERQLNTIAGVPSMLRQQGFRSTTAVLSSAITVAGPGETRALRLQIGEPVLRLRRRRDADEVPLSLDVMSLPIRLLPGVQRFDLAGSVYQLLLENYGIEPAEANETIDVVAANDDQARHLNVEEGASLFDIRRVTYDQAGNPFEFAHDVFRADRTRITLRRGGSRWKRVASQNSLRRAATAPDADR